MLAQPLARKNTPNKESSLVMVSHGSPSTIPRSSRASSPVPPTRACYAEKLVNARLAFLTGLFFAATAHAAPSVFDAEVESRRAELARAGASPQAIAPLLDIFDLWDYVEDRAAVVRFLDDAVAAPLAPGRPPRAAYLAAIAHERTGDAARARELRAQLGLVTHWWIAGPFDSEDKAAHAAAYPPAH